MKKQDHTPEPWYVDNQEALNENNAGAISIRNEKGWNPSRGGLWLASVNGSHVGPSTRIEIQANARRIVACVNACKGIDTILLETTTIEDTLNEAYTNMVKVEKLEAQNAQLLKDMEAICEWCDNAEVNIRPLAFSIGQKLRESYAAATGKMLPIATQPPETTTP